MTQHGPGWEPRPLLPTKSPVTRHNYPLLFHPTPQPWTHGLRSDRQWDAGLREGAPFMPGPAVPERECQSLALEVHPSSFPSQLGPLRGGCAHCTGPRASGLAITWGIKVRQPDSF